MPLARHDFSMADWPSISYNTRLVLFSQTLQGLVTVHSKGVIHRDVSPRNLLIFALAPPEASLCDFGKAISASEHTDTAIGPIHITAPEVWRTVDSGSGPYTNAIDIWSLAYSWLSTFRQFRRPSDWDAKVDRKRHSELLRTVDELSADRTITSLFAELFHMMLCWEPANRITASQAQDHPAWGEIQSASELPTSNGGSVQECPTPEMRKLEAGPSKRPRLGPSTDDGTSDPRPLQLSGGSPLRYNSPESIPSTESWSNH